eukprot:scaffold6247_cov416-Prasinococcus_capsulatus_cf.AAC.14
MARQSTESSAICDWYCGRIQHEDTPRQEAVLLLLQRPFWSACLRPLSGQQGEWSAHELRWQGRWTPQGLQREIKV